MGSVAPDRILKELSELWVTLGKQSDAESSAGVLRACSMTLVVLSEESEDVGIVGETLAALMPEHPARTVLVRLHGAGARTLSDRVYAQCWMPFGQRRQICCEQIELIASDAALGDVPSVVLPLAVADLPLVVWCRSARLAGMAAFDEIARMAFKVVVDSGGMPDAKAALRRLSERTGGRRLIADLAWTRLTRWRQMLSQVFQNPEYLAKLGAVRRVAVHFGEGQETTAWYMAAWIHDVLEDAGVTAEVAVNSRKEPSLLVELAGEGFQVRLERQDGRLRVAVNDLGNCMNLPQPNEYALMREELGIMRRDAVYERTLATASRLANR